MVSRYIPPFDSIIQELAQKLEDEDEDLVTVTSSKKKTIKDRSESSLTCVVCGDRASGCHYRCWTCEGCKGFFRRTVQKNVTYTCEWNNACLIDKMTRTQCQKCRFDKCIAAGMAQNPISVEKQRIIKRIREENKAARDAIQQAANLKIPPIALGDLLYPIVRAYRETLTRTKFSQFTSEPSHLDDTGSVSALHMADMLAPTVSKIIAFAKKLSGFNSFSSDDQTCLLLGSCVEILCLRAALRFDARQQSFPLRGQRLLTRSDVLAQPELGLLSPLFSYAQRLAELKLDENEAALLAATWIFQSSRPDLSAPEKVEVYQDNMMHVSEKYVKFGPYASDELRWLKTLMARSPPLRGISVRAADKLAIYVSIEHVQTLPLSFLHLFEEDN